MLALTWAHPRACGENGLSVDHVRPRSGSSPRVRGKPPSGTRVRRRGRLIPARAGKTVSGSAITFPSGAHPRACGENPHGRRPVVSRGGSSPRVRGKLVVPQSPPSAQGLIPARAGKTRNRTKRSTRSTAHPRACGENPAAPLSLGTAPGSSPRVRGKREPQSHYSHTSRLIPARAGKTPSRGGRAPTPWAHPRACGENGAGEAPGVLDEGSSPRVRGKHFLTWAFTAQAGQILETLEPSAFSGSYSFPGARANGGQRRAHRRGLCTGPALGRLLGAS